MDLHPYRRFAPYLRPYRRALWNGAGLLVVAQMCSTVMPLVLQKIIDTVHGFMDGRTQIRLYTGSVLGEVVAFAALSVVLAIIQMGATVGMRWYYASVSRYVERDLRARYVDHVLCLPMAFFQTRRSGDLMARATNDVEAIQRFLDHAFRMALTGLLALILSLILMCTIDWKLALYSLAPMPFVAVMTRWVSGRVRNGFRQVQEEFAAISARIQESLSGVRVVKAYGREDAEVEHFSALNEGYVERNRRLVGIRSLFFPFTALINGVSMVVILWLGGMRVMEGHLTLGAFVAFNFYLIRLGRPMTVLGRIVDEYQRAVASLLRLQAVMEQPPQPLGQAEDGTRVRGEIELRHVSFAYDGRLVLQDIDLRVPAGSSLAVVGRVGSGKSTLARLLPRLIEATSGQVLVDGRPVDQWPLATLRQAIGYVPQDSFLFSETVRGNIALGCAAPPGGNGRAASDRSSGAPHAAQEAVARAAEAAQLSADLADLPAGLDTVVGERGITLSGGQKQRTALARAILRQPAILILDDALASVDTRTEEGILRHLRDIMAQRTTIVIAHRLSTVRHADRVVVLEEGRIAEQGTHDQLMALDGRYAAMYRRQHLAEELTDL